MGTISVVMGTFAVPIQVGSPGVRRFVPVEALVDTGATHTLLPRDLLRSLGIDAIERVVASKKKGDRDAGS